MNKGGRPKAPLILSDDERQKLETWATRPKSTQRLATRARGSSWPAPRAWTTPTSPPGSASIPSRSASGGSDSSPNRLEGLADEPRPGAPRTITDAMVERVITKTLEEKPKAATHWSTRDMAEAVGLSQTAIVRVWRAFGLKPHLQGDLQALHRSLLRREGPRRRRLYMSPPENAIVLSVDEKSQVQALDRTQPLAADDPRPGRARDARLCPQRNDLAVRRAERGHRLRSSASATGGIGSRSSSSSSTRSMRRSPREPGVEIHMILDNYGTHKTPAVKRWFERHPEYHLHFTPTSGSWLNQVERFFAQDHREGDPPRGVPERAGVGEGDHGIPGRSQRESQAVRVDCRCGSDPESSPAGL